MFRTTTILGGLTLALFTSTAHADEIFTGSTTTLIQKGSPYAGTFQTIGACGGQAQSMTLDGDVLLIGDPNGHIYRRAPGDSFVSYAFDVPNDAQALVMHGGNLLSGGSDGTIARVDASSGALISTLNVSIPVSALLVQGGDLFAGSSFGIVQKGNATTGGFQFWGTCGGPVNSLAIDATHLMIGSSNGNIYRIALATQQVDATFPVGNDAQAMIVSKGDLVVGGTNGSILRVRRTDGLVKGTMSSFVSVNSMAILEEQEPGTIYCYGLGCPCGNNDGETGCAHSRGYGARLAGRGTGSVGADDLEINAFNLPPNKSGRFYMSQNSTQLPLGDGFLCAGTAGYPLFRFPFISSGPAGSISMPDNLIAYCQQHFNVSGHITAGSTWHFQAWYRDPAGPCGNKFNTTNSYSMPFGP